MLPALLAVAVSPAAVTASECCNIHENLISLIILVINWPKEEPNQTYSPGKKDSVNCALSVFKVCVLKDWTDNCLFNSPEFGIKEFVVIFVGACLERLRLSCGRCAVRSS